MVSLSSSRRSERVVHSWARCLAMAVHLTGFVALPIGPLKAVCDSNHCISTAVKECIGIIFFLLWEARCELRLAGPAFQYLIALWHPNRNPKQKHTWHWQVLNNGKFYVSIGLFRCRKAVLEQRYVDRGIHSKVVYFLMRRSCQGLNFNLRFKKEPSAAVAFHRSLSYLLAITKINRILWISTTTQHFGMNPGVI